MAREYHNLRGVVRDITRALREGDYDEVFALIDLLDDVEDARVGIAEDSSGGEPGDSLDVLHAGDGDAIRRPASGHATGSSPPLGGPTGLGAPVGGQGRATALAQQTLSGIDRAGDAVVRTSTAERRLLNGGHDAS